MPSIAELEEGQSVEGFFALKEANLMTTANGNPYIRLEVGDATGSLSGNMWDAGPELYQGIRDAAVVKLRGGVETYRGKLQIKVVKIRAAAPEEVDPAQFLLRSPADLEALEAELRARIEAMADPDYQRLLSAFLEDEAFMAAFRLAPAAKENHHAYLGGLLEHTATLARLAMVLCDSSPTPLDADLLLCGAVLHDIGKVRELEAGASIRYTDEGRLLGHLIIGTLMVEKVCDALPDFPPVKRWLVQHLILSHHGKFEYGSPVLPKIPEALALHHVDNLDAKTVAAFRLMHQAEAGGDGWTPRSWMLETQLFLGGRESAPAEAATPDAEPDTDPTPDATPKTASARHGAAASPEPPASKPKRTRKGPRRADKDAATPTPPSAADPTTPRDAPPKPRGGLFD